MNLPFEIPEIALTAEQWNLAAGTLVGTILLVFGRRLYWLFVATIGFLVASLITHAVLPVREDTWWWMLIPLFVGLVGALLSVMLQKLVIRLGGMLAGAYLGYFLSVPFVTEPWPWVGLGVGALIGFLMIMLLFNGALILLSSILGAMLILDPVDLRPEYRLAIVGAMVVMGCLLQVRTQPKAKSKD